MEALKKFGIKHLSASNINTFISDPASWVVSYIYKNPFKSSRPNILHSITPK